MPLTNLLEINNLVLTYYNKKTKAYVEVLKNISLDIELNKINIIMGYNGSGKSSLIKILCGILPYDKGTILYKGKNLDEIYIEDRNFAYVSQESFLFPKKTVFDNLCHPLLGKKIKKEEIRERIYMVAEEFDIAYLLSRKPKELSIGQIQKLNLIKAFLKKPDVYLLDEPFSNLDLKTTLELRKMLKNIIKENNATCLFVTHNINDALFLGDNIIIMNEGKIVINNRKDIVFNSNNQEVIELLKNGETDEE